jgi:hypothetical protein
VVLGNGTDLELFDPDTGPDNHLIGSLVRPVKVVTSSEGDIYVLKADGTLSKLTSNGTQLWQRQLATGDQETGLAIGLGAALVYAVDGSGKVSAFDSAGDLRWSSPSGTAQGDPLIDRCNGRAYAGVAGVTPFAIAVDSLGLDASAGSWPVGGHDVFQTYDTEGMADVDCESHL